MSTKGNVIVFFVLVILYLGNGRRQSFQQDNCNDHLWKKVRTKVQRGTCLSFLFNWTLNNQNNKGTTETAPSGAKHTKQKITTHKTHVGQSYLSMVLNQRQRQTAVPEWEPYPAKNKVIQKHRKNNIECPPSSHTGLTKIENKKPPYDQGVTIMVKFTIDFEHGKVVILKPLQDRCPPSHGMVELTCTNVISMTL